MNVNEVIWPEPILIKLFTYQSDHFTPEESYDYIVQLILETEDALLNPILGKTYVEEYGEFKGFSRQVVKKFRIYYQVITNNLIIAAVLFPGEQ